MQGIRLHKLFKVVQERKGEKKMVTNDYLTYVAMVAAGIAMVYFYIKCQYFRIKALRKKATQPIRAYKERTELEKKRFMKNSEKMWGVR